VLIEHVDFGKTLIEAAASVGTRVVDSRVPEQKFLVVNGIRLHYLDWGGEGLPWMLCLHGGAQNAHMWDFTALAFCDRFRVLALDQRGHGDSHWATNGDYSTDAHQKDIAEFVELMGLTEITLVGLSMGGSNAYGYAAAHPSLVRSLVVIDIGPETLPQGRDRIQQFVSQEDIMDSFGAFVERTKRFDPNRPEWQIRGSLRYALRELPDGRWTWKYDRLILNPANRGNNRPANRTDAQWAVWDRIACPTLIVRGANSDVLGQDAAREMERRLVDGFLVEVPDARHRVPGDNPVGFEQVLSAFLIGSKD